MYRKHKEREYSIDSVRYWHVFYDIAKSYGLGFEDFYFDVCSVALTPKQRVNSGSLEIAVKKLVNSYEQNKRKAERLRN